MDVTPLFKAYIKTIKTNQKKHGVTFNENVLLFGCQKANNNFYSKAKEIASSITKMKIFLEENKKEYVNPIFAIDETSGLSEIDRHKIDVNTQTFIKTCSEIIKNLRDEVKTTKSNHLSQHQDAVIDILNKYLLSINRTYIELKSILTKRAHKHIKMSKLALIEEQRTSSKYDKTNQMDQLLLEDQSETVENNLAFSQEEAQMFEEENDQLYEQMNGIADEVKIIEGQVAQIFKLQEVFSEKVIEQDQDINRISDVVIGTTENIKEGNEELREVMKKNASFRIWILFFLIVLSFTLLFLDWYNP